MKSSTSVLVLFYLINIFAQSHEDAVKVTTYYESLCPDSMNFFKTQLEPTYDELSDIMEVYINAYGFITEEPRPLGDGYLFDCQHGPDECYGNKMLECAKVYIPNNETYLDFAFCVMGSDDPPSHGEECATVVGVDYTNIKNCTESTEGEVILHNVGLEQDKLDPSLTWVPWVLINDEFSEENLDAAQEDLKALICATYDGDLPRECIAGP